MDRGLFLATGKLVTGNQITHCAQSISFRQGLLMVFTWILVKNSKRTGFLHSLIRIDTIVGIVAGLYLIVTSAISLL